MGQHQDYFCIRKGETDIRDQLKQLIPKTKIDPTVRSLQSEPTKEAVKTSSLGTDHQQELRNLWAAIHTLFNNSIDVGSEVFNLLKQEKETNQKLNQEIRSLIMENNSIKFKNLTLKAKVNELRNTIDAYSDQIDNEWERPKNTFHSKNRGKVDLQNKYSSLLSAPSETESDDFSTYVTRNRHNLKPSFEEQLQTVHLQRKVNFLQQKLVEKSKAIPTNGKPEHGTAKKISPKTNIKTNNTNSSTKTKITVDQKKSQTR